MLRNRYTAFAVIMATAALSLTLSAQRRPDPAVLIAAQKEAIAKLSFMDGVWRGPGWVILPSGEKQNFTWTKQGGTFLDGSVKVGEDKAYEADGKVTFHALAIISYNADKRTYNIRTYALGIVLDIVLTVTADGVTFEIPAGPMTMRHTAVIKDGTWKEVGDRIMPGRDPVRFFEYTLTRVGDSTWPGAGAVSPK